jgi:protein-tyrosine kinase
MSAIQAAIERVRKLREQQRELDGEPPGAPLSPPPVGRVGSGRSKAPKIRVSDMHAVPMDRRVAERNRLLAHASSGNTAQNAYRILRTRLMQRMRSNGWRTLGVSAAGEGEGKTLTAINLAMSISAEIGQEAVLIDLDMPRPMISRRLGIEPGTFVDLADYLEGRTDNIKDLLVTPGIERLGCILNSNPVERSSDLLASPRGRMLFDALRNELAPETVIVADLPPLLSTDDALVVASMVDAMLFVVAEGNTKRRDLVEAQQLLQEFNVIGTLLNDSVEQDPRKYY